MICKKCGTKLPDNVSFCPICTTPTGVEIVPGVTPFQLPDPVLKNTSKPKKKIKKGCTIVLFIFAGILAFFIIFTSGILIFAPRVESVTDANGNTIEAATKKRSQKGKKKRQLINRWLPPPQSPSMKIF